MKTCGVLILVALAGAGCKANIETQARKLIVPTFVGKIWPSPPEKYPHRTVKAEDGVEIHAWVVNSRLLHRGVDEAPPEKPTKIVRGTVVLLHPLMMSSGWFLSLGQSLADRGWDVVLIDLRGHGRSAGKYVTWGAKEKTDVKAVMDALVAEKLISQHVLACGMSLGASVAIQYAAIDPRCKGVLALAPPASARMIGRRMLLLLSDDDFELALARAGEIAGFDPAEASAITAAGKLTCPLVLVHGWLDFIVPYQHSEAIFQAAAGPKRLLPRVIQGHPPELGRNEWIANQIGALDGMSQAPSPLDTRQ